MSVVGVLMAYTLCGDFVYDRFTGLKKGIKEEKELYFQLKYDYPNADVILNPKSGIGLNSFDVELYFTDRSQIVVFDVFILTCKNNIYYYMDISKKHKKKYSTVARNKSGKVFFAYRIPDHYIKKFHFISYKKVFSLTDKRSLPLSVLIPYSTPDLEYAMIRYFD